MSLFLSKKDVGDIGEKIAARHLRRCGYRILKRNCHCGKNELDIIASNKKYIVFAEVKTRRASALYAPREAVTAAKQRRILQTAAIYLSTHAVELQPRFDVIEVITPDDSPMKVEEINHIMGAYETGDLGAAF